MIFKRILVIRGGAIGDFVLTLPAIGLLRQRFPAARLEILGYKSIIALAENRFYADGIRSIEGASLARFFARGAELPSELCDYFASFDLVLSYLFDPDRIFGTNLQRAGVENFLRGPSRLDESEHAARQLARPLSALDLSLGDTAAHLYPSLGEQAAAEDFVRAIPRPIVAFHPGSGGKRKNWPLENWRELLAALSHHSLLMIGGEADGEEMRALSSSVAHRAENLPLPILSAVLQMCAFFLGHDSGVSHIAAASGTPCGLFFGPTNPKVWAPTNANAQIIHAPNGDLSALSVGEVLRALNNRDDFRALSF